MPLRVNGYLVDYIKHNGAIITAKPQRLRSCDINIDVGTVDYTLEGDYKVDEETEEKIYNHYGLTFTVDEDTITYTWPDGFICTITITDSSGTEGEGGDGGEGE
jgi:hypothetical protein